MDHLHRNPPSGVLMETAALSLSFDLERAADDDDDNAAAVATCMTTCLFCDPKIHCPVHEVS